MDAGGDETGAADACCDKEAGDFCEDVDFSEVLATDAYEDTGGTDEVGDSFSDFEGDFAADDDGLNNVLTNSETDFITDAVSNGGVLLLTDDAFLALDGSALLIDTKGLIGLTGEGVYGGLLEVSDKSF